MSDDRIWWLRTHAQLLHRPDVGGVVEAVRRLPAVQAQDIAAFPLALRARVAGITAADVTVARDERAIVRTWGPRGTLHLIAADDLPWLFPLVRTGPASSMRRLRQLGVVADLDDAVRVVDRAMAGQGPLTKAELGERLAKAGLPAEGQAIVHLAGLGARAGLVVLGPDRGGKATYVHAADWLGAPVPTMTDRERALTELVRRYRLAHDPAEPADLAAWSGLPLTEITAAWRTADQSGEAPGGDVVRLLPGYDEYLLGWRTRPVTERYAKKVHPGGGMLRASLNVNGRLAGTWSTRRTAREIRVFVEPFEALPNQIRVSLETEAADVGRFLGIPATLAIADEEAR
jgi:hypothetical protein